MTDPNYVTAREAAEMLGVAVTTLYVYVGRKGLRSQRVPGSRERRYWRADIDRLKLSAPSGRPSTKGELRRESAITLITDRGPFYRGVSAIELADTASLEEIAGRLWQVDPATVFTTQKARVPAGLDAILKVMSEQGSVGRATAIFHLLEEANPRAYDLSPEGMARTGAEVMRWLAAIVLRTSRPSVLPLHEQAAKVLGLDAGRKDLVRRLLVLSADHGFEPGAYAVRAVASTGVTPWRSVLTGLLVTAGRRSGFGRIGSVRSFLAEVLESRDPTAPVLRCLREGEAVPGFGSPLYTGGDPRARALLQSCRALIGEHPALERFEVAITIVRETRNEEPDFALASIFVSHVIGLDDRDSLFLLARSSGWIAHSIEQFAMGETEHREGRYSGPLPP